MSEENKKIDENKIDETIDNAMMRALNDYYKKKLKELILNKLERLKKPNTYFRITTKDGNTIFADDFGPDPLDEDMLCLKVDGNRVVAYINYETIKDIIAI